MSTLSSEDVKLILKKHDILLTDGHFVLKSGRHATDFVTKPSAIEGPDLVLMCNEIARRIQYAQPDVVIGPESGGIRLSQLVSSDLTRLMGKEVPAVTAFKCEEPGQFHFDPDDMALLCGKRCIIIEDTVTTGSSAKTVANLITSIGGLMKGTAMIVKRGKFTARDIGGEWIHPLVELDLPSWPQEEVPDWLSERPINVSHGHGLAYVKAQQEAGNLLETIEVGKPAPGLKSGTGRQEGAFCGPGPAPGPEGERLKQHS